MRRPQPRPPQPAAPPKSIASLPPELVARILAHLPVAELAKAARLSRRFKVLAYSDDVFEQKLRSIGMHALHSSADLPAAPADDPDDPDDLVARLRMLPGGQFLSTHAKYLETGSLFAPHQHQHQQPQQQLQSQDEKPLPPPPPTSNSAHTPAGSAHTPTPTTLNTAVGDSPVTTAVPQITTALPDMKTSSLIIGSGGLKAALAKAKQQQQPQQPQQQQPTPRLGVGARSRSRTSSVQPYAIARPIGRTARDEFRQIYSQLSPYYFDFRRHQNDSKLFKDYRELPKIGALLYRLRLLDRAGFVDNNHDISFSLETTIEWFESMVIGKFESAYDRSDINEMRITANASFQLNGGQACVNVFISKNPIFFDHTYNPTLVASRLPTATGPSVGYALADDFAKFMDYTLGNCIKQADIIAQVFVPDVNAMTLFTNRVFEDSISEYMTAILAASNSRENLAVYLHTLATSIYSCTQFVDLIASNHAGVAVDVDVIRASVREIVKPYTDKYIDQELEHLKKRFKTEIEKWDNRKNPKTGHGAGDAKSSPRGSHASAKSHDKYFSAEQAQAHKRHVMKTMKAIMFAPVTLTRSIVDQIAAGVGVTSGISSANNHINNNNNSSNTNLNGGGNGNGRAQQHQALLNDAEPLASDVPVSPGSNTDSDAATAYQLDDDSLNSLVSLELSLHLMHANKESLGRALVITASTDMAKVRPNVQRVFIALLKSLGERHIKPAFNKAVATMNKSGPVDASEDERMVNMDSLQFFELVHVADLIQQMVDVYYNEDVKPWIDEQDFLSDIVVEKKSFEHLLDDSVAGGMDKAIQLLVNQCEYILLTHQQPLDYNPVNDALSDWKPTPACLKVVSCLTAHAKLISGVADKNTTEVFFSEVGIRLFAVITKNIRRLHVSQTGAMQLICDMNKYYDWAAGIRVSNVTRLFSVLKELGNLFLSDGSEELRHLVHDSNRFQNALRVEEIYELLQSRTDYRKIQKQVEAKECIIQ